MIPAMLLRHWKWIGVGLIIAALWGMAFYYKNGRDHLQAVVDKFEVEAGNVVTALKQASDNPKVTWETAPGQIVAMGVGRRLLLEAVEERNQRIDEQAAEAVRLRKRGEELKRIADKAEAQRQSALKRLSNMSITPGTRSDCITLLREAEEALDLVRQAGA